MELQESVERRDLRKAVAEIASDYGHDYYLAKSMAGEKSTELWQAVGKQGFLGVNISEEFGGGGGMRAHGGFGFARGYHVERYFREARLMKIAPISQQMVLNYGSEHVLGPPRSY